MTRSDQHDEEGADAAADQVRHGHLRLHAQLALDVADGGGGGEGVRHPEVGWDTSSMVYNRQLGIFVKFYYI